MPFLYYLNALFDLQLNGSPISAKLQASATQMECLFLAVAKKGDRVLLQTPADESYLHYLRRFGLGEAEIQGPTEKARGYVARVWGWNTEAVNLLSNTGADCTHPSLDIVRRVNSRLFCHTVGRQEDLGVPYAHWCSDSDEVFEAVDHMPRGRKVIKAPFGTAGAGFYWIDSAHEIRNRQQAIQTICEQQGGVVVEPWLERIVDIGSLARITPEGRVSPPRHHRNLSNRAGTFFGDWIEPEDPILAPWIERLDEAIAVTARRLYEAGYWGVFGCDSFLYRDEQCNTGLVSVFEINARCPMSVIAYGVKNKVAPERPGLFRFIARRRHSLPHDYRSLEKIFCQLGGAESGVILMTPLRIFQDKTWKQPARSAFFIYAPSPAKLLKLDMALRERLQSG